MKPIRLAAALFASLVPVPALAEDAVPPAVPAVEPAFKTPKQRLSYALGQSIGKSFKAQGVEVDPDVLLRGIRDACDGRSVVTEEEQRATLMTFQQELNARQSERAKAAGEKNRREGEAFLAANKAKAGVTVTASGLQYKVIKTGSGRTPTAADSVTVHYRGMLIDGTEFDSSHKRGQPAKFQVGGVIPGWSEALQLMPVGSLWQLVIPSGLAYGERGAGPLIGPHAVLVFEVELISIP